MPDASPAPREALEEARPSVAVAAPLLSMPATPVMDPAQSDKAAAGHGQAVLSALADVQVAVLGGAGGQALGRLAALAGQAPRAVSPRLQEVLQAVAARAAVELARSGQQVAVAHAHLATREDANAKSALPSRN